MKNNASFLTGFISQLQKETNLDSSSIDFIRKRVEPISNKMEKLIKLNDEIAIGACGALVVESMLNELIKLGTTKSNLLLENRDVTFSMKISIARCFNLIDGETESLLNAIRKIRNHFVHHFEGGSFNDDVKDMAGSIKTLKDRLVAFIKFKINKLDNRQIFVWTISLIVGKLEARKLLLELKNS